MSSNKMTKDIEVVRPKLSQEAIARWRTWREEVPIMSRPKLQYTVTVTPTGTGKIITILGGDSDSESENEQSN